MSLNDEVTRLQEVAAPELLALMQAGIDMDLLFRTDEAALTDATSDRLQRLAGSLAGMPGVNIQLDGFADERGDETYNQALAISQEIGDRRGEGTRLGNLGIAYEQQGEPDKARQHWEAALVIYEEIQSPTADSVRQWLADLDDT